MAHTISVFSGVSDTISRFTCYTSCGLKLLWPLLDGNIMKLSTPALLKCCLIFLDITEMLHFKNSSTKNTWCTADHWSIFLLNANPSWPLQCTQLHSLSGTIVECATSWMCDYHVTNSSWRSFCTSICHVAWRQQWWTAQLGSNISIGTWKRWCWDGNISMKNIHVGTQQKAVT